jgi:hypothetical protein
VVFFIFLLDFGTTLTVWYFLSFYDFGTAPTAWYFFAFLLDFITTLTVWYFLFFFYWILELLRQYGIFFSICLIYM